MNKLEVGMWVRYKYENCIYIGKIKFISEIMGFDETLSLAIDNCIEEIYKDDIIGEPSFNIMDVVQVGDYVNEKLVIDKWEEPFGAFAGETFIKLEGEDSVPTIRTIKSIVTKEMFESMKYEVK